MFFPLLITNFKTYETGTGKKALELAKIHEKVARKYGVSLAVAVQTADLYRICKEVDIKVFAQHFDPVTHGQHTGSHLPEALKEAGAFGSLLNHAENRVPFHYIGDSLIRASQTGLFVVVCAKDAAEAKELAGFKPDCIAIEPPELIGGEVSVSTASPEIISKAVSEIHTVPILVGAGVKTGADVRKALQLGAKGILLASGVAKASDPEKVLDELARAMMK